MQRFSKLAAVLILVAISRTSQKQMLSVDLFVAGRVCLFGEHSDWNSSNVGFGEALAVSTNTGIYATAQRLCDGLQQFTFTSYGVGGLKIECKLHSSALLAQVNNDPYAAYILGTAGLFMQRFQNINSARDSIHIINYKTDLPLKKGLSSSAAICVLIVRAFSLLLLGARLAVLEEMEIAYQGERMTPSQCGRLDQMSVASLGDRPGQVGMLQFGSTELDITCKVLELASPVHIVLVTCRGTKNTITILKSLQDSAKPAQSATRKLFGETNMDIVHQAVKALQCDNSAVALGELATKAQAMFDLHAMPHCLSELTAPNLHALLGDCRVQELSTGGKGVGAGGDGTCLLIARDKQSQLDLISYITNALELEAWALTLQ